MYCVPGQKPSLDSTKQFPKAKSLSITHRPLPNIEWRVAKRLAYSGRDQLDLGVPELQGEGKSTVTLVPRMVVPPRAPQVEVDHSFGKPVAVRSLIRQSRELVDGKFLDAARTKAANVHGSSNCYMRSTSENACRKLQRCNHVEVWPQVRRRSGEPGADLRGAQHFGALEPAGPVHLREQPLRHGCAPPPNRPPALAKLSMFCTNGRLASMKRPSMSSCRSHAPKSVATGRTAGRWRCICVPASAFEQCI